MTLSKKLYLLAILNICLTVVVGVIGFWGVRHLDPATSPLVQQMTAIRNSMQVDMMHDAFRGDVMRSLLIGLSGDPQFGTKEEIEGDLNDHAESMKKALEANKELDLGETISKAIRDTETPVLGYQRAAEEVSKISFEDFKKASSKFPEFQKIFNELEDSLEAASDKIQKESDQTLKEDIASAKMYRELLVAVSVLSLIIGILVSALIVRSIVSTMSRYISDLGKSSTEVRTQAQVMTQASVNLSASSTEQAASVQESVAAVSEMLSMISQSADFAKQSIGATNSMNDKTSEGNRIMTKLASSMGSIQQANAQLMDMANIIQEISTKTAVINDIVFKTQLLSFNASIEAARAGQHGRGFAVVAEEVGNLAEMSGTSAREIQALLEDSRKQVASIVESVQKRVSEGETVTSEAVNIFNQIANESQNISSYIQKINEATKEQETGVQQISSAMTQVGSSAQKNNASATETSQSSKRLFEQSNGLRKVVTGLEQLVSGTHLNDQGGGRTANWNTGADNNTQRFITQEYQADEFGGNGSLANGNHEHGLNGKSNGNLADDESFRPYDG